MDFQYAGKAVEPSEEAAEEEGTAKQQVFTVSEVCGQVGKVFKKYFEGIFLQGEISGLTVASSGHCYFQIKDANASISGIMFRFSEAKLKYKLEEGQEYIFRGSLRIYEKRGQTQFDAYYAEPVGIGAAKAAYEQLKAKLATEGMFDEARKKPLPFLPDCIGVVTSPTGAVIRDILKTIDKKYPKVRILIYPSLIQGDQAPAQVAAGVTYLDAESECDVIIIARGGGSFEELSAFNDEGLARAIFACKKPVVSAVGHETDFTICDFVSDLRAATPTAAAEAVVPFWNDLNATLARHKSTMQRAFEGRMKFHRMKLEFLTKQLLEPGQAIRSYNMKVDELIFRLERYIETFTSKARRRIDTASGKISHHLIASQIKSLRSRVEALKEKAWRLTDKRLAAATHSVERQIEKLSMLNPAKQLKGDLARIRNAATLRPVTSVKEVRTGQKLQIEWADGVAEAKIQGVRSFDSDQQPELF